MRSGASLFLLLTVAGVSDLHFGRSGAIASQIRADVPAGQSPFVGDWTVNLSKSKQHRDYQYKSMTVRFAVSGDTVSITDTVAYVTGKETTGVHTFQADGKEHPFEAPALGSGVKLVAKWIGSHVLDTVVSKDGREITRVIYEVSSDGKTLTIQRSGVFEQVAVFDRK